MSYHKNSRTKPCHLLIMILLLFSYALSGLASDGGCCRPVWRVPPRSRLESFMLDVRGAVRFIIFFRIVLPWRGLLVDVLFIDGTRTASLQRILFSRFFTHCGLALTSKVQFLHDCRIASICFFFVICFRVQLWKVSLVRNIGFVASIRLSGWFNADIGNKRFRGLDI